MRDDEPSLLDLWWELRMRDEAIREQEEEDEEVPQNARSGRTVLGMHDIAW